MMKKIIRIAIAGVLAAGIPFSVALANQKGETVVADMATEVAQNLPFTEAVVESGEAKLVITELSAYPMQVEFASLTGADSVVRDTGNVFEFIELHNYGTASLNLNDYELKIINNTKTYTNPWKFEEGNDGVIEAGETFVIFNYTTGSYAYGPADENGVKPCSMKHDTAENLSAAWDTFNEFYGISVPKENRVMSLMADENGKTISGAAQLPSTGENSVRIVKKTDGTVAASVDYTIATLNLSHNFLPTKTEAGELLCVNGVSPYRLLREQDPNYSRSYDFSGEKIRLINYNLLFTGYQFAARASCFADFLQTYSPDIMALEEIATEWYDYLHEILPSLGYSYVEVTVQTGGTVPTYNSDSSNPFIYKTDKFDVLEFGTRFATEDGTISGSKWDCINRVRTVNYCVFQSKATGNKLNVLATHGFLTGTQSKLEQIKIAKNLAIEKQAEFGCNSVIMGDMNYEEGSKYYQSMLAGGAFEDSKYVAQNSTYRMTCASFGSYSYGATSKTATWDQDAGIIDFAFVSACMQVKNYKVIDQAYYNPLFSEVYSDRACHISDHAAVLIDAYI